MDDTRITDAWTALSTGALSAGYCTAVAAAWGAGDGVRDVFAFGRHTPQPDAPVLGVEDRFDLASVTKVLSTAAALADRKSTRLNSSHYS